jgi:hypothetical protein
MCSNHTFISYADNLMQTNLVDLVADRVDLQAVRCAAAIPINSLAEPAPVYVLSLSMPLHHRFRY